MLFSRFLITRFVTFYEGVIFHFPEREPLWYGLGLTFIPLY